MINLEDRIRKRAYELWERAGCPDGRSWEFWFAARREIEAEGAKNAKPVEPPIDEPPEFTSGGGTIDGAAAGRTAPGSIVEPAGRS
jgi:Protein of unknown function (DUF2934)